jgi:6-methylpretetramide 4-monooxygenase / 4-hydroxy-6-methylpretetramide 12a-monooxygenase
VSGLTGVTAAAHSDVLIIGAGPSGLLAAVELARHGVIARLIEREPSSPHEARATALQPGTLEILAQAGVLDEVLASSVHLRHARMFDAELTQTAETAFAAADAGCPWAFQCSLPQWRTEQILTDRLTELGGKVERGVEAVSVRDGIDRVELELKHADGTPEATEARWVVGAGGAHSLTRESMAGELAGETYPGTALVADVTVSCGLPRDGSALVASPAGYVMLAPLPDERWLTFIGDLGDDEAERLTRDRTRPAVSAIMAGRIPRQVADVTGVGWAAAFRMHKRMTPNLADGRRFLLGDAGHLSSPFGGEGLNSGLHDAHNLAWKLALELHGRARPGLLATFAVERGGAARHVLAVSDQLHALVRTAVEAARAGRTTPAPPPAPGRAAALVRARCMLDGSYADSPLTGAHPRPSEHERRPAGDDPVPGPGDRYPRRSALRGTGHHLLVAGRAAQPSLDHLRSRWAGLVEVWPDALTGNGAVLVRPDSYLGFRAATADAAGLAAVDAHLGSYLSPR